MTRCTTRCTTRRMTRCTTRRMNADWSAVTLAPLPTQVAGHVVARSHRPAPPPGGGGVGGGRRHANPTDPSAAVNGAARCGDRESAATRTWQERKALLETRHQRWRRRTRWVVVHPPSRWGNGRRSRGGMA
jgi:hypothetical protein